MSSLKAAGMAKKKSNGGNRDRIWMRKEMEEGIRKIEGGGPLCEKSTTMRNTISLLFSLCFSALLSAQGITPLHPGITVDSLLNPRDRATRIAFDPISGHLWYTTVPGEIVEVFQPTGQPAWDTLRYTAADHGITFLQNILFHDSTMYLSGNVWSGSSAVGLVVRGELQANGQRLWSDVAVSDAYPQASPFADHGFAGMVVDSAGTHLLVASGARTHLGEVRDNGGAWPGVREVPLTTRLFRIPMNGQAINLPNDSSALDTGPYVYAWGLRNTYDLAWSPTGQLFGAENSGERDDPEELNWIREGEHYGFPWTMGGNQNPLQNPNYDVSQDPLVNALSGGAMQGYFAPDPNFPAPPNLVFHEPVQNFGPDADKFRDPVDGRVRDASDEGISIPSFTSHRSPLGLVFDRDSLLAGDLQGDGFLLSYMPGGDSSGYTPLSPWGSPSVFVDPARDLLHLELSYDANLDNYVMTATRIAEGFYLPVDAELVGNDLYVIESAQNGAQQLWHLELPVVNTAVTGPVENEWDVRMSPNPSLGEVLFQMDGGPGGWTELSIHAVDGGELVYEGQWMLGKEGKLQVDLGGLAAGNYLYRLRQGERRATGKLVLLP